MADVVAPPSAPENRTVAAVRGIPSFYQSVMAEMRKVTWPEFNDVRRATIAIIVFVLLLGLVIYVMDIVLQQLLGVASSGIDPLICALVTSNSARLCRRARSERSILIATSRPSRVSKRSASTRMFS